MSLVLLPDKGGVERDPWPVPVAMNTLLSPEETSPTWGLRFPAPTRTGSSERIRSGCGW